MSSSSSSSSTASGETVKLISSDGKEFVVSKEAAVSSGTIKAMLEGNFSESASKEVKLSEIKGDVLAKVVEYMNFKAKYNGSSQEIPEFPLEPQTVIDVWVAANFLDL